MTSTIFNVPDFWTAGETRSISVSVTGGAAGKDCIFALYRSFPDPQTLLGKVTRALDINGNGLASFDVTLTVLGVNVIHCEVETSSDWDSHSNGTTVQ